MDLINKLGELTEEIISRRRKSLYRLEKNLSDVRTLKGNISNLVNDVQIIGNRQFSEIKVQDDEFLSSIQDQNQAYEIGDKVHEFGIDDGTQNDLQLSSILLKALELLPTSRPDQVLEEPNDDSEINEDDIEIASEVFPEAIQLINEGEDNGTVPGDPVIRKTTISIDRNQITKILKKYSLYDDDDDDDDEDNNDIPSS